jgi:hypothetical protein
MAQSGTPTPRYAILAALALLAACYGARDPDAADNGMNISTERVGEPASGAAGKSGMTKPSTAGCAAFRTGDEGGTFDTTAFSGIGGAGATIAATCERCGWNARGDACQSLVYSVPGIENPNYYACLDLSLEFAICFEQESCICSGSVPKRCAAAKTRLDACLETGVANPPLAADGGVPADWLSVDSSCGFGFNAPPNFHEEPVQGIDSCVLRFTAGDCDYFADYGAFSGNLDSELVCGKNFDRIDGLNAELMLCPRPGKAGHFLTGVHFASTGKSMARLTMTGTCRSTSGSMESLALYYSIRFKD